MSEKQDQSAIEREAVKFEMVGGFERAMNMSYRRLVRAARTEWERRFPGNESSDACVKVRVSANKPSQTVPGSGFLRRGQASQRAPQTKLSFPGLAR